MTTATAKHEVRFNRADQTWDVIDPDGDVTDSYEGDQGGLVEAMSDAADRDEAWDAERRDERLDDMRTRIAEAAEGCDDEAMLARVIAMLGG